MNSRDAVLAANTAFYRAFESLDLEKMETVWLNAPRVKCVHPGWSLLIGYGPVMDSWQRIFTNTREIRFDLMNVMVEVVGDLAWVLVTEIIETQTPDGIDRAAIQATNLFELHDGRWLLIHHHGSPVYMPPSEAGPERMH